MCIRNLLSVCALFLFAVELSAQIPYTQKWAVTGAENFGRSVAIYGDVAVVGRPKTEQNDPFGHSKGDAFIYTREPLTWNWNAPQKVTAFDPVKNDQFGNAVATNGEIVAVAAYFQDKDNTGGTSVMDAGAVYLFRREPMSHTWVMFQKITASDRAASDLFGVSLSMQDSLLVVSAKNQDKDGQGQNSISNAGAVYVFEPQADGFWKETAKITPIERESNAEFGSTVSTDGQRIIVGAPDQSEQGIIWVGSAYIFERDAQGAWHQKCRILPDKKVQYAWLGQGVSISGDWAVVNNHTDSVFYDDGTLAKGAQTYAVWHRDAGGNWLKHHNLEAAKSWAGVTDSLFGRKVALFKHTLAIGNDFAKIPDSNGTWISSAGRADVYLFDSLNLKFRHHVTVSKPNPQTPDYYSYAVATDGKSLLVGCHNDNTGSLGQQVGTNAGSAFIYGICDPRLQIESVLGCVSVEYNGYTFIQDTVLIEDTPANCEVVQQVHVDILYPNLQIQTTPQGLYLPGLGAFAYQWLDCNQNMAPIPGATDSIYQPTQPGLYALSIQDWLFGCEFILPCVPWISTGIGQNEAEKGLWIYPNPTTGHLTIDSYLSELLTYQVLDSMGKPVLTGHSYGQVTQIGMEQLPSGFYWLCIESSTSLTRRTVVKL